MSHLSKKEAQARVDRIISFRAELDDPARGMASHALKGVRVYRKPLCE